MEEEARPQTFLVDGRVEEENGLCWAIGERERKKCG